MKLQKHFLDELNTASHQANSLVAEMATILEVRTDSAHRRIRSVTVVSLEEVRKLCTHYEFSLDGLISPSPVQVVFRHRAIDHEHYTLLDWIKNLRRDLAFMKSAEQKEIFFSGKDIPLLYYFQSREMAAFKMYFWMKSMFYYPPYQTGKYKRTLIPEEYMEVASEIWRYYTEINSTEIWTEDCVNITLNQIEFY